MKRTQLYYIRKEFIENNCKYALLHHSNFDYSILKNILTIKRSGRGDNSSYNDVIIMADTETSKKDLNTVGENHVVAWTISLRAFELNIVTLYGHKPNTIIDCINKIHKVMEGEKTIIFFHNLSYDWVFLRKFFFNMYGFPESQLNTKSHYPIQIIFEDGLILRDSLILAQRSLDKWAKDLDVEHQKSIGKWNYDKIRTQNETFTADELEYIEHDTLAGVECIDKTMRHLNKRIYSLPYTATGIPREETRTRGAENHAHDKFLRQALTYEQQVIMEQVYHGGFTHADRHLIEDTINETVTCYDFASSYPFVMLSEKFPMEKFTNKENCSIDYILKSSDIFAFCFKLCLIKPCLKDYFYPMPALQYSKCVTVINPIMDNGRILCADYIEIYLTELDLEVINKQYHYKQHLCTEVQCAYKDYLPRWFTDYIFELFTQKTVLKGGDKVAYALAKAKLNSLYGMCVQKPVKDVIEEQYLTGEYTLNESDMNDLYNKYVKRRNTILPYQWGVWVTAYAFRNLFKLGECCENWVYSDTDSCYGYNWNINKINEYNESCKQKLKNNNYGCVLHNDREYWLGIAEYDGSYSEFRVMGAKRYCGRSIDDNELHITVAGVPKKGYVCLNNDISNFKTGMIFSGKTTGKKTHTYFYIDEIYTDKDGNITGDSIDLSPCDYLLDSVNSVDWSYIFNEEINIQTYGEE